MRFLSILALHAWLLFARAAPGRKVGTALQSEDGIVGISDTLLSQFQLFENFTAASYCLENENATSTGRITCPRGLCPFIESANVTSLLRFGGDGDSTTTDIKGYVALDATRSLIVVAFAGSGATIRNWLTDFTFAMTPYALCSGCSVHSGFSAGWGERSDAVSSAVESAVAANPSYTLVVTGHSIGAAVATLAAAELRASGYVADTYTFGSPRVGNTAFATFVTNQAPALGANYRITHFNDPVPQLPPTLFGFSHTSPEYWLAGGNGTRVVYAAGDVEICEGIDNEDCNAGEGLTPIDGDAHIHYLGIIDSCAASVAF